MYPETFEQCFDIVLGKEGGFQKNPKDRGNYVKGRLVGTKYGISARSYPEVDIPNLTVEGAKEIYFRDFWQKMKLHLLDNKELILKVFDMAINAGVAIAVKLLQQIIKTKIDGILGKKTAEAANKEKKIVEMYKEKRIEYYKRICELDPSQKVFLRGWIARAETLNFNHPNRLDLLT